MTLPTRFLLLSIALAGTGACPAAEYRVVAHFPVGGEGGYDYVRFDETYHRLFLAHQKKVDVLDADTGRKLGEIAGTNGVHGIALAPEFHHGFTSNGADRSVTMFDLATLAPLKVIKYTGVKPDAIEYDPQSRRVYVANGSSTCDVTVIDPATGDITATIALAAKGKLEGLAFDGRGRMFVNDEEAGLIHVVDLAKLAPVARWPLAPAEGPTGLAVDAAHHRLFSACGNEKLAVLDSDTGRLVALVPVAPDPDGAVFNPAAGLVFSPGRAGTITIIRQETPDSYVVLQNLATAPGCRTIALDAQTGRVFMPTAGFGPAPAPTKETPHPRPPMLAGSFEVVVVGP